jgi:hypothetical protein
MPFSWSRFSVRAPMPGRSRSVSWRSASAECPEAAHQAVGLFHIAGHLGQIPVRRQAHRAAQHGPDLFFDRGLHRCPSSIAASSGRSRPISRQAISSIDKHRRHRQAALDSFHNAMVIVDIKLVARLHQHHLRDTCAWRRPPSFPSSRRTPWPRSWRQCHGGVRHHGAPRPPAYRAAPAAPPAPPKQSRSSGRRTAS